MKGDHGKAKVLIVGYGNPLRSDDAIGLVAADNLSAIPSIACDSSIEIIKCHQLMPELSEKIANSDFVIFIDAAAASQGDYPGSLNSFEIEFDPKSSVTLGHHCTPSELVSFSVALLGGRPKALAVSLTAASFDYGETLTEAVQGGISPLIEFITTQIREFRRSD